MNGWIECGTSWPVLYGLCASEVLKCLERKCKYLLAVLPVYAFREARNKDQMEKMHQTPSAHLRDNNSIVYTTSYRYTRPFTLFHNPKLIRYQLFSSRKGAVLPPNPLFRPSTVTISGRVRVVAENRLSPSLPLARSTGKLHQYSTRKQPYYSTRSD